MIDELLEDLRASRDWSFELEPGLAGATYEA